MGNRAVITTRQKGIGIYLHWNGGRESIEAFLLYCKLKGYRRPESDSYGWARLCQVISNFFGGGLSIGIGKYENLDIDNGDNGVYVIEDWKIVDRIYDDEPAGWQQDEEDLMTKLKAINESQPTEEQIDIERELKRVRLIERLESLAKHSKEDKEKAHVEADKLLLEYLGDYEIKMTFESIGKWYA